MEKFIIKGNNNIQVKGNYTVISQCQKKVSGNIEQRIEELKLSINAVHYQLDRVEGTMVTEGLVAAFFSILFIAGIFLHQWVVYFISIFPLVAIGVLFQKPRGQRRLLKIELKAHEQAYSELTKQKLLDQAAYDNSAD